MFVFGLKNLSSVFTMFTSWLEFPFIMVVSVCFCKATLNLCIQIYLSLVAGLFLFVMFVVWVAKVYIYRLFARLYTGTSFIIPEVDFDVPRFPLCIQNLRRENHFNA